MLTFGKDPLKAKGRVMQHQDSSSQIQALQEQVQELQNQLHQLNRDNQLLQQAQGIAGLGIWQYDIKADKVTWSEEVYRIYNLDLDKSPPKMEEILHYASEEERQFVENQIYKAIVTGKAYSIDCTISTAEGPIKFVHATGQPFYNDEKELTHLVGTILDISDRKQADKSLRFSDFTIESISDGIFWIDKEANFIRVNKAASHNLGYTPEELKGMSGKDINPGFSKKKSQKYWSKTKEDRVFIFRTEHTRKDGSTFPVEITNNIFEFDGEEFRCSIVRDITEQLKKEQKLERALKEIESLKNQLEEENIYLQEEIKLANNFDEIISISKNYKTVLRQVEQVAATSSTVLITGESGTGKELLARAVHNLSKRRERPLVKVNCANLPANIIESELFGHERGAFTGAHSRKVGRFELANKGTIFLDEVGELPFELQAKLLRVLQEGEFERLGNPRTFKLDVRVIAATNRDLEQGVNNGEFRADLFYRLNVFPLVSLPLRDRKEDIPHLVQHFVKKYSARAGKEITTVSQRLLQELAEYDWPGNIRELENIIERAVILSPGKKLEIGNWFAKSSIKAKAKQFQTLEEREKEYILEVLAHTKGRVSGQQGAALILGINPKTLDSRLRKLGIHRTQIFDM